MYLKTEMCNYQKHFWHVRIRTQRQIFKILFKSPPEVKELLIETFAGEKQVALKKKYELKCRDNSILSARFGYFQVQGFRRREIINFFY